jgi:hypothetical protein
MSFRRASSARRSAGGVITSFMMELMVYPAIFFVWKGWALPPSEAMTTTGGQRSSPP